ncbi:MAG: non-hydrolyzing UDP-N-acetylglucosamine 2-epimerase [Solirubrobacteraceae bacterium]
MSSAIEHPTSAGAVGGAGSGSRVMRARRVDDKAAHQLSTSAPTAAESATARAPGAAGEPREPSPPLTPRLVVPIVVGTRPEAIKLVPIILAMRASESLQPIVVSTGQHHRMVREIFELAGIATDVTLWAGGRRELNERVSSVMRRFEDFVVEWFGILPENVEIEDVVSGRFPAAVLVHGDTSSAMAAALAAFHLRIPVMHVEAGLRTGGLNLTPFPEELNRQLISCMACAHLAPTARNMEQLVRENVSVDQIFVTGNTGIDALRWASGLPVCFEDPALQAICDGEQRVVVVTAHRRESWANGLDRIAEGVGQLAREHGDVRFVIPLHPNPLVREKLGAPLRHLPNVLLTEPLSYAPFAKLLGRCDLVITDSGGIQEEAPALGKPVLVTREQTERSEGIDAGTLLLVGTDPDRIFTEGHRLLTDPSAYARMSQAPNPYGDGHAAERIVAAFEYVLRAEEPPTQFGSGFSRTAVIRAAGFDGPLDGIEAVLARATERERLRERRDDLDETWLA